MYHIYLHKPAHSPNCFPSGTLIKGILCSEQRATTNFLYASSSHASLRTHMCAWRRSRALEASRRPLARPSCISASLRTPFNASITDICPLDASPETSTSSASATIGEVGSSTSDYEGMIVSDDYFQVKTHHIKFRILVGDISQICDFIAPMAHTIDESFRPKNNKKKPTYHLDCDDIFRSSKSMLIYLYFNVWRKLASESCVVIILRLARP